MSFGPIDFLFNIVVMLFWFRAWNNNPRLNTTNPYLSNILCFTQPVLDLLYGIFRGWTPRQTALICWSLLIIFRGLALPALNPEGVQHAWIIRLGFHSISPAICFSQNVVLFIIFSFLSFAVFLFQIWTFALLFLMDFRQGTSTTNASELMHAIARPFSSTRIQIRPYLLLGYGILLALIMHITVNGFLGVMTESVADTIRLWLRYAITATAGAVNMLLVLRSLLIILIIASWISAFAGTYSLAILCREWLDFFLGPFRRFRIQIGPIDLTAIIAFFIIGILHSILNHNILPRLYMSLQSSGF